jgi:hypothetical protein
MTNLVCPHCKTTVPHGARVCTGCQAEVHYGVPPALLGASLVVAIGLGFYVGIGMDGGGLIGAIAGIAAFATLAACSHKALKNSVDFKRIYRTK